MSLTFTWMESIVVIMIREQAKVQVEKSTTNCAPSIIQFKLNLEWVWKREIGKLGHGNCFPYLLISDD